jgi:hypothetical protein
MLNDDVISRQSGSAPPPAEWCRSNPIPMTAPAIVDRIGLLRPRMVGKAANRTYRHLA